MYSAGYSSHSTAASASAAAAAAAAGGPAASAAAGATLEVAALLRLSEAGETSSAAAPNRGLLEYPHNFFQNGKVPENAEKAKLFWKYRENRPIGTADLVPPDGESMLEEMMKIKRKLAEHTQNCFDEKAIQAANELGLKFPNGQCSQAPRTAADLQKAVAELEHPTDQNIKTYWRIFYRPFQHGDWSSQVIDAWLLKENKALIPPPEPPVDSVTGKKTGRKHVNARGGWTNIATTSMANKRRIYCKALMDKRGWRFDKTGPKGCGNSGSTPLIIKGMLYKSVNIAVDNGTNGKPELVKGWLVTKVKHIFCYDNVAH